MSVQILDHAPAFAVEARVSRRGALLGSAAAALGFAVVVTPAADASAVAAPLQASNPALLDLARDVEKLAGRCRATFDHLAGLEDAAGFGSDAESHRLARVRRRADREDARLDSLVGQLAAMPAKAPAELAAKARAACGVIGEDWASRASDMERHADLIFSVVSDAARLGMGALS